MIKLRYPIASLTGEIAELHFRKPTAADYFYLDEAGHHLQMQTLIASLTGQDRGVIKALRGSDYLEAVTKAQSLIFDAESAAKDILPPEGNVLQLIDPVPVGQSGRTVSKLTFRNYTTAEDYRAFDLPGGINQAFALIASLSGTDIELIKRLSARDYLIAVKKVDAILEADASFEKTPALDPENLDPKKQD